MRIISDLHTHTVHSHGEGSVEDNVRAAIDRGLERIAISDHDRTHWTYGIKDIEAYFNAIDGCRQKYAHKIEVLTGVEANILSIDGKLDREYLERYDVVILGYHKLVRYRDPASYLHFFPGTMLSFMARREKCLELNTRAYLNALKEARIDIIAHPGYGVDANWEAVARECVKTGTVFELNNNNLRLAPERVHALAEEGTRFVVSSDAHVSAKVGVFDRALEFIERARLEAGHIINAR